MCPLAFLCNCSTAKSLKATKGGNTPLHSGCVLVLDPGSPTAVATVRSLGSAGWRVGIGANAAATSASASKWCVSQHEVPNPENGIEPFVDAVNRAVDLGGYELLFGCGDAQVFALSRYRNSLRGMVPYSPDDAVKLAFDKLWLTQKAEEVGIGVPKTLPADDPRASLLRPPLIAKARWQSSLRPGAKARFRAIYCQTAEDVFQAVDQLETQGAEPIIQEAHEGCLMSFNIVTSRTFRPLAMNQHVAHVIWPLRIGTPARAITVEVDPQLAEKVARLLELLQWFGLVNLQFIVPSDGIPRLIDFNGRPYQTLALSLAAGVNFMDVWAREATNRPVGHQEPGNIGVRYHDLIQDLLRINASTGLSAVEVFRCLRYAARANHIVWQLGDPLPAFRHYRRFALRYKRNRTEV